MATETAGEYTTESVSGGVLAQVSL